MAKHWTEREVRDLGVRTDLVTAASVIGISRPYAYELAKRGEFPAPVLRLGRKYVVPVAGLLAVLGIEDDIEATA
ncbi:MULTISPECIES: helix-turn-helix transcriptional regulator [Rhodococcus]|uniref:helix-turn-helix transcriptional regulator n=1 Tax=Rhodococcus TaxID=1827 RepID=UPI001C2F66C9|nr:helix-turn-helix domain-containing protein [Rhodococcus pyridinivorans]MCD2117093.1 AlpA family phage regulatory protein [Rhodococcus pyridinivorans]MCZ4626065.1 AlpA family phage regulatory protein [Rhodococcus pyridinivorans]MCZ4647169.1 AlpA family phage regulatory protein [Rhodococcus pyridinivorans]MDJ0483574.1 AlpA family phage regulatory protein [Rhodococcus pyridinivorans]MDV7253124.1 helix-turn-helix domain-containing protein [Rhodococcus pyridinivorans]